MFKAYYQLTKPGIVYGNILTTIGGFLFAAGRHFYPSLFLATVIGTSLIIASACVFNNYIDRDIDAKMKRTSKRSLVSGEISGRSALIFGTILGIIGTAVLGLYVNGITLALGLIGWISYVGLYTPAKRRTVHSTLIGSISGATPIVAGYTAITGRFDVAALILFIIMFIWQLPHFYAIAMFRLGEYKNAGIPILAVTRGMRASKQQILAYSALFLVAVISLAALGKAGYSYLVIMAGVGVYWLYVGIKGLYTSVDDVKWARSMFGVSLIVLLALSGTLALDAWLP